MITTDRVLQLIEEKVEGTEHFLVDLKVFDGNNIRIMMDGDEGFSIQDCIAFNRHMEQALDREVEDFSMEVTSPGLDQPFSHVRQYIKNVGRQVKITSGDGQKLEGLLEHADESGCRVKTRRKERIEGRKAKHWVEEVFDFAYSDITEAKVVISFK